MENIPIYYQKSKTGAIELAAQELGRCLGKMTRESLSVHPCDKFPLNDKSAIWIGGADAFPEQIEANELNDEMLVTQRGSVCFIIRKSEERIHEYLDAWLALKTIE